MNFHNCTVTHKHTWAAQDGYCKLCRPVETHTGPNGQPVELTQPEVEEIMTPTLDDLIAEVGGLDAFEASVAAIQAAKASGQRGDAVNGRLTRELLNLVLTDAPTLIDEYFVLLARYDIGLTQDADGVYYHDYSSFNGPEATHATLAWEANLAERRAMRRAMIEAVRATRSIVMHWMSADGAQAGQAVLGLNTPQTRALAARYQTAGREKGFTVTFQLEPASGS